MTWLEFFETQPLWFALFVFPFGLVVGSFLNVVIHRLPIMMEREWKSQCQELLELEQEGDPLPRFDLAYPGSRCPHCQTAIKFRHNVPVASYIVLGGKCHQCAARISGRYPLVEILTGLTTFIVGWHFGPTISGLFAIFLTWGLLALTFIDLDEMLLPDSITMPLLWLGLLLSTGHMFVTPAESIIGAAAGYLSLWTVYMAFKLITGKEGMGFGDFKLLALLGAWMGWQALPAVILISSVVGVLFGVGMMLISAEKRGQPIPFGPYLAVAGWIVLLWGSEIQSLYLGNF